uniref:FYVE-type domain-containing protein n=1 Tax=Heterorhabditis bacteriophora TaxID=37862 RepID=A0A1I7XJ48_HETBA
MRAEPIDLPLDADQEQLTEERGLREFQERDLLQQVNHLQTQLGIANSKEVRWQWDEDVENCSGCDTSVVKLKPRPRCLHCGKIFCHSCVKTTVPSGPNRRPANVCQVCHTLLNRDSKPFFAEDPRI